MPRMLPRQERGSESSESVFGDAVPYNGVEDQAVRRAHFREQTMARQAVERRLERPLSRRGAYDYQDRVAEREAEAREELARIDGAHQVWLRAHGRQVDESLPRQLPSDGMEQPSLPASTTRRLTPAGTSGRRFP